MYLPESRAAPVPVLVVCLGGVTVLQPSPFTVELYNRLMAVGAGVVTFDFYGMGETGGDPNDWTYGRWTANLIDVCTYVSAQEWADGDHIGALGVSAGSTFSKMPSVAHRSTACTRSTARSSSCKGEKTTSIDDPTHAWATNCCDRTTCRRLILKSRRETTSWETFRARRRRRSWRGCRRSDSCTNDVTTGPADDSRGESILAQRPWSERIRGRLRRVWWRARLCLLAGDLARWISRARGKY
jgi:hypothetical protein